MNIFGVVEVDSTNIRGFGYSNGVLEEKERVNVNFKGNYKAYGKIIDDDRKILCDYVNNLKEEYGYVEVVATGLFKNISEEEKNDLSIDFFSNTGISLEILTQDMEDEYVVKAVTSNIKHTNKLAIMLGGINSTKIAIVQNHEIIEKKTSNFGAISISKEYEGLKEDVVNQDVKSIVENVKSMCNITENTSDVLILAGGNYTLFYELLKYPVRENPFFKDENAPYYIDIDTLASADDNFYYNISLQSVKEENKDTKVWWDGTRAMRVCIKAVADALGATFIVPTKITMIYGVIDKIKQKRNPYNDNSVFKVTEEPEASSDQFDFPFDE